MRKDINGRIVLSPILTVAVISISTLFLDGCLFFSPESAPYYLGDPTESNYNTLSSAILWANGARSQLHELKNEADVGARLTNYGIAGLTFANVGVAAFQATKDLIVGLGVGAAGLTVVQYVTDTPFEERAISDGLKAIDCLQETAVKMDALQNKVTPITKTDTNAILSPPPLQQAVQNLQQALLQQPLQNNSNGILTNPIPETGPAPSPPEVIINQSLANALQNASNQQQVATTTAEQAIGDIALSAPQYLVYGTLKVRRTVFDALDAHLPKTSDISSFIDSQKQKLKSANNNVQDAKAKTAQVGTTATNVQSAATANPTNVTNAVSQTAATVQSASSAEEGKQNNQSAVLLNLADAVQSCKQIVDSLGAGGK